MEIERRKTANEARAKRLNDLCKPTRPREKVYTDGIAKNFLAQAEFDGRQLPGAGQYNSDDFYQIQIAKTSKGKFSQAKPKSAQDWDMIRAANTPAPGDFDTDHFHRVHLTKQSSGKFSAADPKVNAPPPTHLFACPRCLFFRF